MKKKFKNIMKIMNQKMAKISTHNTCRKTKMDKRVHPRAQESEKAEC